MCWVASTSNRLTVLGHALAGPGRGAIGPECACSIVPSIRAKWIRKQITSKNKMYIIRQTMRLRVNTGFVVTPNYKENGKSCVERMAEGIEGHAHYSPVPSCKQPI